MATEAAQEELARDRFIVGVDLDGVCADFVNDLRELAGAFCGVHPDDLTETPSYGFPEWNLDPHGGYEALHRFAVSRHIFRDATVIEGAAAALRYLSTLGKTEINGREENLLRIRIITYRLYVKYTHLEAITQTAAWLEEQGIPYWDLCMLDEKSEVLADIYIDDTPDKIRAIREQKKPAIVFTNSANKDETDLGDLRADTWADVVSIVEERFSAWKRQRSLD